MAIKAVGKITENPGDEHSLYSRHPMNGETPFDT